MQHYDSFSAEETYDIGRALAEKAVREKSMHFPEILVWERRFSPRALRQDSGLRSR